MAGIRRILFASDSSKASRKAFTTAVAMAKANGGSMRTIDVAERDWPRTLDELSARHEGGLVTLEVLASAIGAQEEIRELPLLGITAEIGGRDATITIAAALADGGQIGHIIHSPTRLQIERSDDGVDVAVQVESADGAAAILTFKAESSR